MSVSSPRLRVLGPLFALGLIVLLGVALLPASSEEPAPAVKPKHLGGRWYLRDGKTPVYLYKDGGRFVDLVSYHAKDSNKDGIDNVRLRHDDRFLLVESQGYPNHPTALFPNSRNPNTIRVQQFKFRFPLEPKKSDTITRVPMGPIGMALNGVVFYNPFEAGGRNAVEGYSEVWLDSCCGHPDQRGVYHYHKYPSCVKTPFPDEGKAHSPIIGFAFDGFPVYGPYEEKGVLAKDLKGERALDVCNGHSDAERGYHYHVTPGKFPYILGGYHGVPETSNNRGIARTGSGAIKDNASGTSREGAGIRSVTPGSAGRGKTHTLRIELDPEGARGLPDGKPSWVQVGPYEAKKIHRDGNVVLAEIAIPADAGLGVLLDCHLEWETPQGRSRATVLKKNDVFRVIE
jgi:hypothetical protein